MRRGGGVPFGNWAQFQNRTEGTRWREPESGSSNSAGSAAERGRTGLWRTESTVRVRRKYGEDDGAKIWAQFGCGPETALNDAQRPGTFGSRQFNWVIGC